MADELDAHLSEDEDLERAKKFWNENGKSITAGVVLGLAGILGFNGWQSWQKSTGEDASMLYSNLSDPALPASSAAPIVDDLMEDYGSTPYAAHGAMLMAKREVEADNLSEARNYLQFVVDNAEGEGIRHIGRIRLAMVLLAMEDADAAVALVEPFSGAERSTGFQPRYLELLGDAHAMLGNDDQARDAWQQSQEVLEPGSVSEQLIKLKLDNLGNFRS